MIEQQELSVVYDQVASLLSSMKDQSQEQRQHTIVQLKELYEAYSDDKRVALPYAMGVFNLMLGQDLEGRADSVSTLQALFDEFNMESFALVYAKGLFNLTVEQNLEGIEDSVSKLKTLLDKFETESFASEYAKGLVNLIVKQEVSEREGTVSKLALLYDKFTGEESIALGYAKGLFNLSLSQTGQAKEKTVDVLKYLFDKFKGVDMTAVWLRYLIVSLANENLLAQDGRLETNISDLQEVLVNLPENDYPKVVQHQWLTFNYNPFIRAMDRVFYYSDFATVSQFLILFKKHLQNSSYDEWLERLEQYVEGTEKYYELTKQIKLLKHYLSIKDLSDAKYRSIGHYTSLDVLVKLLRNSCSKDGNYKPLPGTSRLYNANYMNDPQEGQLLDGYLNWEQASEQSLPSSWYLMSLTTNVDNLTMWSQYGRQGSGVSLVFDKQSFELEIDPARLPLSVQRLSQETETNSFEEEAVATDITVEETNQDRFIPYRICYLKDKELVGDLFDEDELIEIKKCLNNIKKALEGLSDDDKEFADVLLEEIRYLFKSADYQYEGEVRFLTYVPYGATERIKCDEQSFPRLYVDYPQKVKLSKVIFGPKLTDVSNYTPYLYWYDKEIEATTSQIRFR